MTAQAPISLFRCAAGGIACAILYLSLAVVSRDYGDAELLPVLFVYALTGVISVWVVWPLAGSRAVSGGRPIWWIVLGFGVLFRLLGTLTFPVLEDDFYRYLWDGWQVANTGFPYAQSPAAFFGDTTLQPEMSAVLDGINYPDVVTVYGPFLQLLFGLGYLLAPGQVAPLQVFAAAADIAVLLVLWRLLAEPGTDHSGRNASGPAVGLRLVCWILYAWSPLLIKEFATTAHPDVFGAMLVVCALWSRSAGRVFLTGVLLGLALGVKPFAAVILPFLLLPHSGGLASLVTARVLVGASGLLLAMLLLSLPFVFAGKEMGLDVVDALLAIWVPEGLRAMGAGWVFNSGLYEFLQWLLLTSVTNGFTEGSVALWLAVRYLPFGAFFLVWCWQIWRWLVGPERELPLVWLFGFFLLVLPALNPWYLVWWLPFAVLRPSATAWCASVAILLSYVSAINLGTDPGNGSLLYNVPAWVLVAEYCVVAFGLTIDRWRMAPRLPR